MRLHVLLVSLRIALSVKLRQL